MNYFCTYFDINFFYQGMAMVKSLEKNCKNFIIYILCLDSKTYYLLKKLNNKNVRLIRISFFIKKFKILLLEKKKRDIIEFYFLLTPFLIFYILKKKKIKKVFYLDADLLFISSLDKFLKKLSKYSISIVPHRFNESNKYLENIAGIYNVGFLSFKKDSNSLACLDTWKRKCLESTSISTDLHGKVKGDQFYLNDWPSKFQKRLKIINDIGFGCGAWNVHDYNFSVNKNKITINNKKLIMIHANFVDFISSNYYLSLSKKFEIVNIEINNYYNLVYDIFKNIGIDLEKFIVKKTNFFALFKGFLKGSLNKVN
jgi:hypothetical protein